MKKILAIFVLLLNTTLASTQNISYDDIIEKYIKTNQFVKAYTLLLGYQEKDPTFANTYFQLGNISYYNLITSNPIKQKEQVDYYISNCRLYYDLCLKYLNEQPTDARKNSDYYKTIPEFANVKKVENPIVISYIEQQKKKIAEIEEKTRSAFNYFAKFTNTYNKLVDIYNVFLAKFANENDIYLYPKDSIFQLTKQLIQLSDSCQNYFNLFQEINLSTYYVKFKKQNLYFHSINYYMLDGATRSNLLADTIYLWNYKKWATEVQNKLTKDITNFRDEIISTYGEMLKMEKEIATASFSNNRQFYEINPRFVNLVEKYDPNSIITSLIFYKKKYLDLLIYSRRNFNNIANTKLSYQNRLLEFLVLLELQNQALAQLEDFKQRINYKNYLAHKEFFDFNFKNYQGLNTFVEQQTQQIKNILQEAFKNLNYLAVGDVLCYFNTIRNKQYPMFVNALNPLLAQNDSIYTVSITKNQDYSYIAGYYKSKNVCQPYFAVLLDTNQIFSKKLQSTTNELVTNIVPYSAGYVCVIRNFDKRQNSLVFFDNTGKQTNKINITTKQFVRNIYLDEVNNYIIISAQGNNIEYSIYFADTLSIEKIDLTTKNTSWSKIFEIKGNFVNLTKFDTTFHIIANFIQKTPNPTQQAENKILDICLSENGIVKDQTTINTDNTSIFALTANKIDEKTLFITITNDLSKWKPNFVDAPKEALKLPIPIIYDINKKSFLIDNKKF